MKIKSFLIKAFLVITGFMFIYPLFWMVLTSFKSTTEAISNPLGFPHKWMFSNYIEAIKAFTFFRYLLNSGIYTIGTVVLTVVCATLFAYAAARMRWKLNDFFMRYMQMGLMVPISVIILSLYQLMRGFGIKDTYQGLILVYTASALPIAITVLYGYLRSLPFELEESAFIDGASVIKAFVKIILPMISSAMVTIIIIVFMNYSWNEFFIAFITIGNMKMNTIPVGLQFFSTFRGTEWGLLGAALVLTSIPSIIVYSFASEKIESALTVAGVIK